MDSSDVIQLLVIVLLLALSAFFSSSETALTTVSKIRVRSLAESGSDRAIVLSKVIEQQGKMLSAILIGNNIVNLSASSLLTALIIDVYGNKAVGVATGILTVMILVFGEITPKTLSTISAESIALRSAGVIYALMWILTPVITVINKLSLGVLMLLNVDPNRRQEMITADELRTIVEVSHEEGVIETEEKKMINNVFDFGDSLAKDVMVPRIDMTFVDVEATYEELLDIFRKEKYTRIPVYENSTDNVIGVVNVKDLLMIDDRGEFHIREHMRKPLFTYEYKKTAELMVEMRGTFKNIVIVLDEYGTTAGLITLEDMLEEIVGELRDEFDEDEEESLVETEPGVYSVAGAMKLSDINDRLGLGLESEDYDSVGGLVIGLLDHLPGEGEEVCDKGIRFIVESVDKNRIDKICMILPAEDREEEGESAAAV